MENLFFDLWGGGKGGGKKLRVSKVVKDSVFLVNAVLSEMHLL